jgi:O-antigen ligase
LSRASYLALIPVFFILPVLTRRLGILIAVTMAALVVMAFPRELLPRAVFSRIDYTFNQQAENTPQVSVLGRRVDTSTSARLIYMSAATDAFVERPVFGWGVTGWHFVDSQYFRTLSETGIVGFAAFVFLVYRIFAVAFHSRRKLSDGDPVFYGLSCGFIAGFVGLLVHAIGSNTFIIVRIMEPFWLCCALVYVLPEISRADQPAS